MSANGVPAKFTTECKLCHRRIAEAPPLNVPLVGDVGKRPRDLLNICGKHLAKHHQEVFQQGLALFREMETFLQKSFLQEMQAFLIFSVFQFEDPTIQPRLEQIREATFVMIEHMLATVLDADKVKAAVDALRGLVPTQEVAQSN